MSQYEYVTVDYSEIGLFIILFLKKKDINGWRSRINQFILKIDTNNILQPPICILEIRMHRLKREENERIKKCYNLYNEYKWLLDSYIVDFFVDNYWDKLLPSWRIFFENNEPETVAEVLNSNQTSIKKIFPLSILAIKTHLQNITLIRHIENSSDTLCQKIFPHEGINKLLWKHVKQKKVHEISYFGKKCAEIAVKTQIDVIIDCGSGLGHLARLLGYKYKLNVTCLEAEEKLSKRAILLDQDFERRVSKYDNTLLKGCCQPKHINYKLKTDMPVDELLKVVLHGNNIRIGLVGLHPCGDLASALLRFFKTSDKIAFVCTVGCCYMKLTEIGHPLQLKTTALSYEARELACHAIERLVQQLYNEGVINLRTHAWRAALEEIMVKRWPNMKHAGLRSVKYSKDITFGDYCLKTLKGTEVRLTENDINTQRVKDMLLQIDRVVIFNCLRTLFAPLLETIVLLDRLLYVSECEGTTASIEPVFNPLISSRNHLLSAYK